MAKPMKSLELQYPMIQFLIIIVIIVWQLRNMFGEVKHKMLKLQTACVFVKVITWFRVQFGINKHE